jgi:hypothetical protein
VIEKGHVVWSGTSAQMAANLPAVRAFLEV